MSTLTEKLRGLVETLYQNTEDDKIVWKLSSDKEIVESTVSDYKIQLSQEQGDGFESDIRVTIFDDWGDQVDTFNDNYFRGYSPLNSEHSGYYSLMAALYESARRQASGATKAIDTLLDALGGSPIKEVSSVASLDEDTPF